jgi:hypothetical protein
VALIVAGFMRTFGVDLSDRIRWSGDLLSMEQLSGKHLLIIGGPLAHAETSVMRLFERAGVRWADPDYVVTRSHEAECRVVKPSDPELNACLVINMANPVSTHRALILAGMTARANEGALRHTLGEQVAAPCTEAVDRWRLNRKRPSLLVLESRFVGGTCVSGSTTCMPVP